MQPNNEAYEAEDRCFRVAVATRLMLPHPAVVPKQKRRRSDLRQTGGHKSAPLPWAVGTMEVSTAGMRQWPDVLQT